MIHKVAELKESPFVSESGNKYEINIKKDIIAVLSAGGCFYGGIPDLSDL